MHVRRGGHRGLQSSCCLERQFRLHFTFRRIHAPLHANMNVMVTATSVADATKSASAALTIVAASTGVVAIPYRPGPAILNSGSLGQFGAIVTGSSNTAVTWSASAGTISASGLYTAPTVTSNGQPQSALQSQATKQIGFRNGQRSCPSHLLCFSIPGHRCPSTRVASGSSRQL